MVYEREELRDSENRQCLDSIEEQWGIFQYNLDVDNKTIEQVNLECGQFKEKIFTDLDNGNVIKNPGFYNQYINEKLSLIYNYYKGNNIIKEIKEKNFQTAKTVFVKKKEETFEFDQYIKKCDMAINLDKYSFIPYYLKGICKIMSGNNGKNELEKSLFYIEEEIKRYLYFFGLFVSLNINIDLLYYQINLLNKIVLFIEKYNKE